MSNCYWDTSNNIGLSSDISIELYELILINLAKLWLVMPLGVDEVFLQDLVRHEFSLVVYHIELVWKHSLTQPSFILLQLLVLLLFLFSI